ncbi:MAG: FecR domain-containing protein [Methylococcaceae bacterium]|jgi:Tfp pilus assembly protein PilF
MPLSWAEEAIPSKSCPEGKFALLNSLQGEVYFDEGKNGRWHAAKLHDAICEGSRVKVEPYSRASLSLPNDITLRLDAGTVLTLNGLTADNPTFVDLIKGFVHFLSRTPKKLEITSPIANAGPEGTEFAMHVSDTQAELWVYEGAVKFYNAQGSLRLSPNEGARAQPGQAPLAQINIKPEDAVAWALYYPPLFPILDTTANTNTSINSAILAFRQGHAEQALSQLDKLPSDQQTTFYFKVRAAMRLTVGRTELANADIVQVLGKHPNDAEALALKSVMALSQNQKDEAWQLANQAISSDPQSAAAYSALSYVEQSRFQLEHALAASEHATKLAPNDAMVWARKAELQLSKGDTAESLLTAQHAYSLDANLERTQTVLGYAQLLHADTDPAILSFQKAINLDSTSPLARLGLGLAKIRQGDVAAGRQDIEIAAILDPANSLIRSYLGKAYFDERRSTLAEDELNLAKARDPKDPTPYFYDAILKQTTNRPVKALEDIQQAVSLNDNKAVYRSSLLLDKDLAARSAAQGRIYNDLGFQRLGLLSGWKSVNVDPTNYSAHRLLADNYASQPRHEIARVSELLQSQLLQPLNITPIQPQLSQSNVLILDGLGPSSLSFNEYNPLFARNRFALQTNALYGSNNTFSDDVVHSGLWDNGSYSLGQFHYESDGYRANNALKQDIYNVFVQSDISDKLNLQSAYSHEERKNGDLSVNFNPNSFSNSFQETRKLDTYRLGGRFSFSNTSSLIGSLIYQDLTTDQNRVDQFNISRIIRPPFPGLPPRVINTTLSIPTTTLNHRDGFISELQYLYKSSQYSITSGFGHIEQNVALDVITGGRQISTGQDTTRSNVYSYLEFNPFDKAIATLGLSYDTLKIENFATQNPISPKLGLIWNPAASTTFRAAFFRGLNITRVSNQTIEPTQVAGFNQLFDDPNGSVAWRYGLGLDHTFSKAVFAGLEYTERDIDAPISLSQFAKWKEQTARTYLYITPHDFVSASAEYFYENFDRQGSTFNTGVVTAKTQWVPITFNLFHPSGFSLTLRTTYVNQSGIFQFAEVNTSGKSDFNVTDVDISYRLPARHGIVSVGVKNLFDNKFQFQSTNQINSNDRPFAPDLTLFTRINLSL